MEAVGLAPSLQKEDEDLQLFGVRDNRRYVDVVKVTAWDERHELAENRRVVTVDRLQTSKHVT